MRKLIALSVIAVTMVAASTAQAAQMRLDHKPFGKMTRTEMVHYLKSQIRHDNSLIRFWKNHSRLPAYSEIGVSQVKWAKQSLRIAGKNLHKLLRRVIAGSDMSAWMCIHNGEGSWSDPDGPYWGGLQMDYTFQSEYGPEFLKRWGTADHWPVWAQITAARRARDGFGPWKARGYHPWPTTAHNCGLI